MVDFIMVSCCFMNHNMSLDTRGWMNTNRIAQNISFYYEKYF